MMMMMMMIHPSNEDNNVTMMIRKMSQLKTAAAAAAVVVVDALLPEEIWVLIPSLQVLLLRRSSQLHDGFKILSPTSAAVTLWSVCMFLQPPNCTFVFRLDSNLRRFLCGLYRFTVRFTVSDERGL
jgi:hypothetical protein